MQYSMNLPLTKQQLDSLKIGDIVLLNGTIYAARDAAHQRMVQTLDRGEELPISMEGTFIYYVGPTPAQPGQVIGSAGPTTAGRMDRYAPRLLDLGQKGMIAKGRRNAAVKEAIVRNGAVYLGATGGAGALLSKCIIASEVVAYDDLGTEAIRKLEVKDFPTVVIIDAQGNDLYETIGK